MEFFLNAFTSTMPQILQEDNAKMLSKSSDVFLLAGEHLLLLLSVSGRYETHIAECDASRWRRQRADPFLRKMRFGRGLLILAPLREIGQVVWLKDETIL